MPRDAIRVEELEISCVIGVYPEERVREQPVRVSIELGLGLERAGLSGELAASCDYARVAEEAEALLRFRRYRLLESAAEETAAMLLAAHPRVESVRLRFDKLEPLRGRARAVGVSIARVRADFPRRREAAAFGVRETVLATAEASLELLQIEPGRGWTPALPPGARVLVFGVHGQLARGGGALVGNDAVTWTSEHVQETMNIGTSSAALFACVHAPAT